MSDAVPVGLSSRYWWPALKVSTPAGRVSVVLPSPGPQVMTTVCVSSESVSLIVPVTVAVPFSSIGELTVTATTGAKFFVRKYSPLVVPSPMTRTRYRPGVRGVCWMNSLRPSAKGVPEATRTPDGLYSSIFGFRVLANSPVPSAGVAVSSRRALSVLVTLIEYQSSFPTVVPLELAVKTASAAAAEVPNAMIAIADTWDPPPRPPKLKAWLMPMSPLAPLGSSGELMMSNGLVLKNPSAETTLRVSAEPNPTVRPLVGPDARTN